MKKKYLIRGLMGIGIGNIISGLIGLIIGLAGVGLNTVVLTMLDYAKYVLASSVIGFVFSASSVFFEDERISFLKATIIHFFSMIISYYGMGLLAGWLGYEIEGILISLAIFVVTYIIIWTIIYLSIKSKVSKMNKKINEQK